MTVTPDALAEALRRIETSQHELAAEQRSQREDVQAVKESLRESRDERREQQAEIKSDLRIQQAEVKGELKEIKAQVKLTNGRVTAIEMWKAKLDGMYLATAGPRRFAGTFFLAVASGSGAAALAVFTDIL